jgi:hypothetical protein
LRIPYNICRRRQQQFAIAADLTEVFYATRSWEPALFPPVLSREQDVPQLPAISEQTGGSTLPPLDEKGFAALASFDDDLGWIANSTHGQSDLGSVQLTPPHWLDLPPPPEV